jgi:type I restriction enzyme S subunit
MSGAVPKLRFDGFAGEWTNIPLSNLISALDAGVSVNSGERPAFAFEKSVLKTSCVTFGRFDLEENKVVEDPNEITRLKEAVSKNTVIISRMNTPQLVGANAFVAEDAPTAFLPDRLWAAKISAKADPSWVGHLLAHPVTRASFSDRATGTSGTMKNLTKDAVLSLEVIAPTLPEQQKIAAFLGAMDGRLAGLRRTEAALVRFKAGLMQRLFSQKLRFTQDNGSAFPDWEEKRLGDVALVQKGEQVNRDTLSNENAYPVINGGTGPSGFHTEFNTAGETITISEGGNSCGYVAWQNRNFWCGGHCYSVIPRGKGLCKKFLFQALKNDELAIMRLRVGSGLPNIQKGDLSKMTVSFPHPDEQRKIAAALSALDAKIAATSLQITKTERFKQGLLQQMFV